LREGFRSSLSTALKLSRSAVRAAGLGVIPYFCDEIPVRRVVYVDVHKVVYVVETSRNQRIRCGKSGGIATVIAGPGKPYSTLVPCRTFSRRHAWHRTPANGLDGRREDLVRPLMELEGTPPRGRPHDAHLPPEYFFLR